MSLPSRRSFTRFNFHQHLSWFLWLFLSFLLWIFIKVSITYLYWSWLLRLLNILFSKVGEMNLFLLFRKVGDMNLFLWIWGYLVNLFNNRQLFFINALYIFVEFWSWFDFDELILFFWDFHILSFFLFGFDNGFIRFSNIFICHSCQFLSFEESSSFRGSTSPHSIFPRTFFEWNYFQNLSSF